MVSTKQCDDSFFKVENTGMNLINFGNHICEVAHTLLSFLIVLYHLNNLVKYLCMYAGTTDTFSLFCHKLTIDRIYNSQNNGMFPIKVNLCLFLFKRKHKTAINLCLQNRLINLVLILSEQRYLAWMISEQGLINI